MNELSYRPCVGIMLLNADKKVWVGKRVSISKTIGNDYLWQMPQGGIDKGEEPEQAALREMFEELGTDKAKIVAEHPDWLKYDLPYIGSGGAFKGKFVGQTQKWFALEFTGQESEFNLAPDTGEPPEFDDWKWVNMDELPDLIVPFKRDVYVKVVHHFKSIF